MEKQDKEMPTDATRPLFSRVLILCVPPALLLIAGIGTLGFFTIHQYVNTAIERNVRIRSTVIARSIETFLENRIRDISYLRQGRVDRSALLEFMQRQARLDPDLYREAAFLSTSPSSSILFVMAEGMVRQIPPEDFSDVHPNPMLLPSNLHALDAEEVFCTTIMATDFPFPAKSGMGNRREFRTFRMITPYSEPGMPPGYLVLGVDARRLRNVLSQVSTSKDKAWGFERSNEVRFSYLFDTEGWMLFQSEAPDSNDKKLSTYLARSGFLGTLGKPGLLSAFLPDKEYELYWETVNKVRKEQGGVVRMNDRGIHKSPDASTSFMAFEPIRYTGKKGEEPRLFSGMVYIDRSQLAFTARKSAFIITLVWVGGTLSLLTLFLCITRLFFIHPLQRLKHNIAARLQQGVDSPMIQPGGCEELNELATTANQLFHNLDACERKLNNLSEDPMSEKMQQPVDLRSSYQSAMAMDDQFSDIIGISPGQIALKAQVLKAAGTNVDIFIVGETGTGKQLVAEAIHRNSARKNGPFVSINCGALNESLLLDALFGHVKGAHSEAKNDRKGAFIESSGGTLFLDEIQAASPKVQQSLLRAIAERKIRPLGSDAEIDVDIRLVTATNKDLTQLIKDGQFREDLFYRLYVLTIHTLPLRHHKEDIPLLAYHYLKQTQEYVDKSNLLFSKGAIKKLLAHDWPGNVRELVNCITRTVVFAEGPVIQADELRMEDPEIYLNGSAPQRLHTTVTNPDGTPATKGGRSNQKDDTSTPVSNAADAAPAGRDHHLPPLVLSPRQIKVLPALLERKVITRKEYQHFFDDPLPARTANYDLNDMMHKGILKREGAGSTTRYVVAHTADIQVLNDMINA